MLKFAICDDEPHMAQEIAGHLADYMNEKQIGLYSAGSFSSGLSLLESGCDFDVIFLDIQMEQPDGMETARMLRQRNAHSLLIFITVLKECVFDAFAVEAYDYLVKPLDSSRFRRTMDRAVQTLARRTEKSIVIQQGTSCKIVPLSEIVYCEVQGRKIYIHQDSGEVIDYYDRMDHLERRVDRRFFRCHRSYLVNLSYVRGCQGGQVILPRNIQIPVSRLRERELTQALLRCMKERG